MKKVAVILLICIYSLAIMGFSLKQFYCCGNLKTVTLSLFGGKKISLGKNDCCKTTYRFFKLNQNHIGAGQIHSPVHHFTLADYIFLSSGREIFLSPQGLFVAHKSHAPPLYNGVPIYLSNRVFLI
ncbi:MAG: hypothetical protein ABI863_12295 [Ginsengibacter sp.]